LSDADALTERESVAFADGNTDAYSVGDADADTTAAEPVPRRSG
jgi:hypothetical protein